MLDSGPPITGDIHVAKFSIDIFAQRGGEFCRRYETEATDYGFAGAWAIHEHNKFRVAANMAPSASLFAKVYTHNARFAGECEFEFYL